MATCLEALMDDALCYSIFCSSAHSKLSVLHIHSDQGLRQIFFALAGMHVSLTDTRLHQRRVSLLPTRAVSVSCRIAPHVAFTLIFVATLPKLEAKIGL